MPFLLKKIQTYFSTGQQAGLEMSCGKSFPKSAYHLGGRVLIWIAVAQKLSHLIRGLCPDLRTQCLDQGKAPPGLKFCTDFLVFSVVWQGPSTF